jgi:hypothetical protein
MSGNDFVLPRSLEPERLRPPSATGSRRHKLRGPLIILIASIFAAPIGNYFGETVAIGQPSATGAQAPPSSKTIRVLDPEEIELLMKQGEQFIAAGDVVTARIVFQRAAEAGNANAAMALGATYDPTVLAKLGVVGMGADVEKARSWYQKAEDLGAPPEARGRLLEARVDRFVPPALGGCALTREPPYQLKSDTVDWTMQISRGQSCVLGLRHGRVTIHTAKLISPPQSGQVKLLGSGFSYTAKSDFGGKDSFMIQVSGMLNGIHGSSDIRIIASVGPR